MQSHEGINTTTHEPYRNIMELIVSIIALTLDLILRVYTPKEAKGKME